MPICERCGLEHDGTFGSGRFCSSYCAATRYKVNIYKLLEDEVFKTIPEFEDYMVSNFGNIIKNVNSNYFLLNPKIDSSGYKRVTLTKNNNKYNRQVHRLVMLSFYPCENSDELLVNHKDENPSNNNLENLEWCTHLYNVHYGTGIERMKANQHCKKVICLETNIIYYSISEASRKTGINIGALSDCCHGKIKSINGQKWKFYEN